MDNFICFFELNLIKDLGYDPNLNKYKDEIKDDQIKKIKIDDMIYEIPKFLISRTVTEEISKVLIKKSLYFTRNVIQNKFFIPNNLIFPRSRILLENYFN